LNGDLLHSTSKMQVKIGKFLPAQLNWQLKASLRTSLNIYF